MGLRDVFRRKTDSKKVGEAATRDADVVADETPYDISFSLDVWVEGVDPIVEYIPLAVL